MWLGGVLVAATERGRGVLQTCSLGGMSNPAVAGLLSEESGEIDLQELPHGLAGFPFTLLCGKLAKRLPMAITQQSRNV